MGLIIQRKVVGFNQTNCWLIGDDKEKICTLIDAGARPKKLWQWIGELGFEIKFLLFTHSHLDHIGGAHYLQRKAKVPCYLHPQDIKKRWKWLGFSLAKFTPINDGDILKLGSYQIKIIHTPGHSPGSVCYLIEDNLFCGDLLFAGGVGRWDIPGGSFRKLVRSLEKISQFDDSIKIFPGHGPATVLGEEKRINPLLKRTN